MASEQLECASAAMLSYAAMAAAEVHAQRRAISTELLSMLPELQLRFDDQLQCVRRNGQFFKTMLRELQILSSDADDEMDEVEEDRHSESCEDFSQRAAAADTAPADLLRLQATLFQLRREWSDDGAEEREACFGPMLQSLHDYASRMPDEGGRQLRVLVPGAGLGRLVYEASAAGHSATGLESSYYMLLPAHFVLNKLLPSGASVRIFPFAGCSTNVAAAADVGRHIDLPGESALALEHAAAVKPCKPRMLGTAFEDFAAQPRHEAQWDALLTAFFLDACPHVVNAVILAHRLLRDGGLWINNGPLMYHGQSPTSSDAPRLTADELLLLLQRSGFELLEHSLQVCEYSQDPLSMCRSHYRCLFFVAQKQAAHEPQQAQ